MEMPKTYPAEVTLIDPEDGQTKNVRVTSARTLQVMLDNKWKMAAADAEPTKVEAEAPKTKGK